MKRNKGNGDLFSLNGGLGYAECVFYDLLMKNGHVTIKDVRDVIHPESKNLPVSLNIRYIKNKEGKEIEIRNNWYKKAGLPAAAHVVEAIREKGGKVDVDVNSTSKEGKGHGDGKTKIYRYEGDNILWEERIASDSKAIKQLIALFEASSSVIPLSVSAHFLENTGWKETDGIGNRIIYSDSNQRLTNLSLIPELYEHIAKRHVLKFSYHHFGGKSFSQTVHPHVLKLYNNRWFLFGYAKDDKTGEYTIKKFALDRIECDLCTVENVNYRPCEKGTYERYFAKRVGVSSSYNEEPVDIIVRAHSAYAFGLMETKPLHPSQKTIFAYNEKLGYGDIQIHAVWNKELRGALMHFGDLYEIVAPKGIRQDMEVQLTKILDRYLRQCPL